MEVEVIEELNEGICVCMGICVCVCACEFSDIVGWVNSTNGGRWWLP